MSAKSMNAQSNTDWNFIAVMASFALIVVTYVAVHLPAALSLPA